ncbi:AraC family transcriptional regulator [Cohnella sp. WQ 127256]|uniref:AraC family transcriptional regulator n=1 Tax=Cohnella sp. WQ 127256 TaxID=2938790 RepID=UPI0021195C11|nr:AraC family transcriptional regulator [Cohnella sp. WQ 127256]
MPNNQSILDNLQRTRLKPVIVVQKLITLYYFEFGKNYKFPGEKHNFWEFLYVDRGEVEVSTDEGQHLLKQGSIIFHKPNEFHRFHAVEGIAPNVIVITFDCHSPAMRKFNNKVLKLGEEDRKLLVQIMNEGQNAFVFPFDFPLKRLDSPVPGSEQLLKCYLEMFLIVLFRRLDHLVDGFDRNDSKSTRVPTLTPATRENFEEDLFKSIVRYLVEHLAEELSVKLICNQFYISRTRLQNLFQKYAGNTFMEYIIHLRIRQAKSLIREETYNLTGIAEELGFSSIHYFSKVFKKETGMSPSEYARSVKARMGG